MEKRINELTKWLKQENIEFAFITSTANIFYLSKFYTHPHERVAGVGVFQTEEPFMVCPKMEMASAKNAGWRFEIIGYDDTENPWTFIQKAIENRNVSVSAIAIEKDHLSFERGEKLQGFFPNVVFKAAEEKLNELRLIKDKSELAILREAAKLADFGVEVGVNAIKENVSELEIVAKIEYELKKKGIRDMSFSTMVLTGAKTAAPHGVPSLDKIQKGDLVLFDLGVIFDGYCSDITRTVAYHSINEKQQGIYDTVLKAQLAAVEASKPRTEIGKIDKAARDIIRAAGYGEFFTHRIGHGLGIDVHEFPSLNATNTKPLRTGMCYTIEPGIYIPEIGGVRIEDDIYITDSGAEVLTKYPKELQIVK
ncbi:MAG TPA: aminopeptidase P family protein [Bacillales bacterium]|nr:aminopeptidase P family protein [Bacillales bacterium]